MATTFERHAPRRRNDETPREADRVPDAPTPPAAAAEPRLTGESILIGGLVAGAVLAGLWVLVALASSTLADEFTAFGSSMAFEDLTALHVLGAIVLVVVAFFSGGWAAGSTSRRRTDELDLVRIRTEPTAGWPATPTDVTPLESVPADPAPVERGELRRTISRQRAS